MWIRDSFIMFRDQRAPITDGLNRRQGFVTGAQLAGKMLDDEASRPAGDVHELADHVRVDTGNEIIEIEVDILHRTRQLRRVVVAQPFRVQALREIAFGGDESAA